MEETRTTLFPLHNAPSKISSMRCLKVYVPLIIFRKNNAKEGRRYGLNYFVKQFSKAPKIMNIDAELS